MRTGSRGDVPKRELVRGLVTAFEIGRLKIAKRLPLAGALLGELQAFQVRFTAAGGDTYAGRSGAHDDLVMATALAVWFAGGLRSSVSFGPGS